ncbi:AAA family ATPase [Paraflavitalea speifideaquila]|uniref:AAA family ATPase n=1 Tax=Paraflavitalea speifideaquila TaxID=3076558 RepID=UPI0028EC15E5|nr:AAA family ATPase [Paraflavitalea speifideiaquila]
MIQKISINNYKSIRNIELDCKKLNVFIGEPNSGKSNIIEALSLMSQGVIGKEVSKDIIRYKNMGDLFFDFNINRPIEVLADVAGYRLKYAVRADGVPENQFHFEALPISSEFPNMRIAHDGLILNTGNLITTEFRFYEYKRLSSFAINFYPHLAPPYGDNLPALLLSNKDFRSWVSEFF